MSKKRKFFRQVIEIEVLSEDVPLEWDELNDIEHAIIYGDCSGVVNETLREEVTGPEMAKLLIKQGSDPEFFMLTNKGKLNG